MSLRLLVVEGNVREVREARRATFGKTPGEAYAEVLAELAPDADCDICRPTDADASLPETVGLDAYDGVVVTGSALNLYDGGPSILRQIELARAVYSAKTPFFGSCWGLQLATAAAGGEVIRNPLGREIGFARNIALTEAGLTHPLLYGRPRAYEAPCSHLDVVALPPAGALLLAANPMSAVQAAEIRFAGGCFWGVQYHPEYALSELAMLIEPRAAVLVREGFFCNEAEAKAYCEDLRSLDAAPHRRDIAWRLGLGEDVVDLTRRRTELRNFLEVFVRKTKSARGRA